MKNKLFLFLLCLPIVIQAQQVEFEEAMIAGKNAILNNSEKPDPKLSVEKIYTLQDEKQNNVLLYEVIMEDGQAVLLSGYKMCMPVLGYFRSDGTSILDTLSTKVPPGLISLVKGYAEQVQSSFKEDFEENEHNKTWYELITQKTPSAPGSEKVSPLLKSKWNQDITIDGVCNAYNYYVPKTGKKCEYNCFSSYDDLRSSYNASSYNKCTTGCVAVAMAQVMYYWKYPKNYDWCNMEDSLAVMSNINCDDFFVVDPLHHPEDGRRICDPNPNYEKQRDNVAKLIYDAAELVDTYYCLGETCASSANILLISGALKNDFGYHSDAVFRWKSSHTMTKWKEFLKTNLDNERPVIYGSLGTKLDAHCFVCDGYRSDDFFHFNWGWGGYQDDSWWKLDYIRPDCSKKSGTEYKCHYDISEYAVFDIYPDDNFNFCNYNVTLPFALSFIPAYPTNLTLDFNSFNNTITSGQNVTYKAHNSIIIKPGFRAAAGSKFRAYIEPCAKCPTTTSPSHLPPNPNINSENEDENENFNISNSEGSISVFPNPTTGIVNIIAENTKIEKINVFDISGKVLENNNNFAGTTLDLSWLSNGVYFIKIQTPSEQTTHKVIIQK